MRAFAHCIAPAWRGMARPDIFDRVGGANSLL
jgi:hypothetical protein